MEHRPLFPEIPQDAEPRITELPPLASDPNVRRIKVAGRVIARLPVRDVEQLGLEVGQEWTNELARRVAKALEAAKARRAALTMLGRRALSRGELRDRLLRRGHAEPIAQRVTDELAADHWIDDEAYAVALAEELASRRSASRAMIVEKLVRRKIDEELAHEVATRVLGDVDPVEAAAELARRRLASMQNVNESQAARRIAGQLARRGYDEETIAGALHRAGLTLDE